MTKISRYNRVFETAVATVDKNVKDLIVPKVMTNEDHISLSAKIHGKFSKEDENLDVGTVTVFIDTLSQLLMIEDDNQFIKIVHAALINSEVIEKEIGGLKAMTGKQAYVPAKRYNTTLHGVEFSLIVISKGIEQSILNQLKVIDINNANNLRALLRDLNDCGRMYQELTLDAAKKLYKVIASFYQEFVRAESTIHLDHSIINFSNLCKKDENENQVEPFKIFRKGYKDIDMEIEVGEINNIVGEDCTTKKLILKDHLAEIQNSNIATIERAVNDTCVTAYTYAKLSEETIKDLDLNGKTKDIAMDLVEVIVNPYHNAIRVKTERLAKLNYRKLSPSFKAELRKKIVTDLTLSEEQRTKQLNEFDRLIKLTDFEAATLTTRYEEEFNNIVDKLSNLVRYYTRNLSMVDAGRALFAASNITINAKENSVSIKEKPSKAYLNIAPELGFAYLSAVHADMKICGYKLLGKTDLVAEGDVIEFANGNALGFEGLYIDDSYDGKLKVQMVNDVLSAVIDIEELVEANRIPYTVPDQVSLRIFGGNTYDYKEFINNKRIKYLGSHEAFDRQGALDKAVSMTLYPVFRYKDKYNKDRAVFNAVVASIPSEKDPTQLIQAPICSYICYSSHIEEVLAGLTFTSMNKNNMNGKVAWATVQLGDEPTYIEVEKRLSVEPQEDGFGNVSDFEVSTSLDYVKKNSFGAFDMTQEELNSFEKDAREMGVDVDSILNTDEDNGFNDVYSAVNTAKEKTITKTVEVEATEIAASSKTTEAVEIVMTEEDKNEFSQDVSKELENLGFNMNDVSDFSAFQ